MIKKFLKYSALLIVSILISILSIVIFVKISYIKEPQEYGICIDSIENNSDTDVTFINLLEETHHTIKAKESITINSWLAASDWESYPNFFFRTISRFGHGSVGKTSERSCMLITKAGLFRINLGASHGLDSSKDVNIWVSNTKNENRINTICLGYPLVTAENMKQKRKIIINESTQEAGEPNDKIFMGGSSHNFSFMTDFEFRLSDNVSLSHKRQSYQGPSIRWSEFKSYKQKLKKENNIKFVPCSTSEKSKPSTHQNHDVE